MRSKRNLTAVLVVLIMALLIGCGGGAALVDPIDESGFSGSGNDYTDALATDTFVTVDGKFDEDCWTDQKPFEYVYEGVRVRVTTVFGELGFYVGFTVTDPHVYACEGRDVWKGSSVEMYVDRGDTTKKSVRTFQYRLDATGRAEMLNGYETNEDAWTGVYLPIYGRTQVQGVLNSGNTEGMTAEIFVRWDALGYDYAAEGFAIPESVKIMPVYNQSSGADLSAPRDFWVNNGGNLGSPNEYWLFDKDGFSDGDRQGAVVGDSAYGRAKSCGWDVSAEAEGIVKSDISGDQAIFFTDVYAADYAVTTLMTFESALNYWNGGNWMPDPYPKAGLIVASDRTLQAYVLDYDAAHRAGDPTGMFFQKGNPDPRDNYWKMFAPDSLSALCDASRPVRLTGVKSGRYLLIFVGDENTEKFGGTFVGMREVPETAGKAAPGFYTLGCAVSFTDYAVTTDPAQVSGKLEGILSVLELEQTAGGALTAPALGYRRGETATVTVTTYEGYVLRSIKVGGVEKLADVTENGTLEVAMDADKVTVTPQFVRAETVRAVAGTLEYEMKNARPDSVSVIVRGQAGNGRVLMTTTADSAGAYGMRLPDGTYTLTVLVDGILRAEKSFAVSGADLTLDPIAVPLNWVFDGAVQYNADGSAVVAGFNQFRPVKNVSAEGDFALTSSLERADGNFGVSGTWETGGIGIRVEGVTYRIYVMRENASDVVVYVGIDGGATQEYRQGGTYAGTGAPIRLDLAFVDNEIHLLLDRETHYVLNAANTPDPALKKLFTSSASRQFGFVTVGKDMVFSGYDFAVGEGNAIERAMRWSVTLPATQEGYTVTADKDRPFVGESVELTFTLEESWVFDSILVNGVERKDDVSGGKLRLKATDDLAVEVEARYIQTYAVSGTYTYKEGLYSDGDTVTVSSGTFTGTAANGAWRIALPDGRHTLTLTSARFAAENVEVTVSGGAVTVSAPVVFRYLGFVENEGYTRGEDGSVTVTGGPWTGVHFAGVTAADGFAVTTTLQRTDNNFGIEGTWETGGFTVNKNGTEYVLYVMRRTASEINVYLNITNRGEEGFAQSWESPNIAFAYQGTGAPLTMTMVYTGDTIYLLMGGKTVAIFSPDGVRPAENTRPLYRDLFTKSANDTVTFGLLRAAPPEGVGILFTDTRYSVGAAAVEAAVEAMRRTVTLPEAAHITLTIDQAKPFVGETVTIGWTVDEGWQLAGIAVNGTDMTDRIQNGKLILTAAEDLAVTVTVVELQTLYPVTGTYTYAAGLYGDGDTVSVKAGLIEGTIDTAAGTWSIELPDGDYTLNFTSSRFAPVTYTVTVSGGNVAVETPITFTQIAFTQDSTYTRDGDAVIIASGPWTPAYFAGIDAKDGMRVDTHLERSDGNFGIEGTWGTGGFVLNKNGIEYMVYVMRLNAEQIAVYINNKADLKAYEVRAVYSYQGTGAPLDVSLIYLGDSLRLRVGNEVTINFDAGTTGLTDLSDAYRRLFQVGENDTVKIGLGLMDMGPSGSVRFTDIAYSSVTTLPDEWTGPHFLTGQEEAYPGGVKVASQQVRWLDDGTGAAVTAAGDYRITYSLERLDGNFGVSGTWDTAGFALGVGNLNYRVLVMADLPHSRAAVYLQCYEGTAFKSSVEYWIPYAYAGTGAPLTVSVAYTSADETLHLYAGGAHYAFTHGIKNSADDAAIFAAGSKTLGFFTNFAAKFSDVSYSLDASEVASTVAGWGSASTPT